MSELKDILRQLLKDNEEMYSLVGIVSEIDENKRVCTVTPSDGSAEIFDVRLQSSVSLNIGLVHFPKDGSEVTVTFMSKELAFISQTSEIEKVALKINDLEIFIDEKNIKNTVENYETTGKNSKFTTSEKMEFVSSQLIKMQAVNFELQATNIKLTGILQIIGNTTATGTTTLNGAVTIAGATSITGAVTLNGGGKGGIPMSAELVQQINGIIDDFKTLKQKFTNWTPVPEDGGAALKSQLAGWTPNVTPITENDISNPDVKQ